MLLNCFESRHCLARITNLLGRHAALNRLDDISRVFAFFSGGRVIYGGDGRNNPPLARPAVLDSTNAGLGFITGWISDHANSLFPFCFSSDWRQIYHSHPHAQRVDSFKRDLTSSALHTAHSLIHMLPSFLADKQCAVRRAAARDQGLAVISSFIANEAQRYFHRQVKASVCELDPGLSSRNGKPCKTAASCYLRGIPEHRSAHAATR